MHSGGAARWELAMPCSSCAKQRAVLCSCSCAEAKCVFKLDGMHTHTHTHKTNDGSCYASDPKALHNPPVQRGRFCKGIPLDEHVPHHGDLAAPERSPTSAAARAPLPAPSLWRAPSRVYCCKKLVKKIVLFVSNYSAICHNIYL